MFPPLSAVWGWPWHGLCSGGSVTLPNASTKTMTQPAHGSAWLIDMGRPAITRTPSQVLEDTALGYEWRNYGMVSGGSVHGTALGPDKFIHVDAAGQCWLIGLAFSFPEYSLQKVRVTISIVRFGLFGEGAKTPIEVVKDVQCTYFTYTIYGATYTGTRGLLEDVWTNGSRCLVSVVRNRATVTPLIHDIFSLIEISISGTGGVDGSGLVFDAVEVMRDTQLSYGAPASDTPFAFPAVAGSSTYSCGSTITVAWASAGQYWLAHPEYRMDDYDNYTYARFAYYNSAGQPKAARIRKSYNAPMTYLSTSHSSGGSISLTDGCSPGVMQWTTDAALYSTSICRKDYAYGIYLLENDTIIDWLELHQSVTVTEESVARHAGGPYTVICGNEVTCDIFDYGSGSTSWGSTGVTDDAGTISARPYTESWSAPQWRGSLASSLPLPTPPDISLFEWSRYSPPLSVDALTAIWRSTITDHETSGVVTITGSAELGLQRIDAKAAAFFVPGTTRTYGTILTPLGNKTTSLTPAGNLYFAWQRKTGDFAFSANPICHV